MCYHCTRDPRQPSPVPDHRLHPELPKLAPLATLARLCRVSKQLRDIATPVLYHCPITTRPELLVRTIFDRFDLAGHILEMHHSMWQNWPLGLASYPLEFQDAYYKKITRLMNERYGLLDGAEFQSYEKSLECNTIEDLVKDTVILEELFCVTAISLKAVYRSVCMGIDPDALQSLEFASITNVDGYVEDAEVDIQACTGSWLHSVAHDMTSMHYSQAVIDQPDGKFLGSPELTTLELQDCNLSALALLHVLVSNPPSPTATAV